MELPGYVEQKNPAEKYNALRGCGSQEPHKVVTCGDGPIQWGAFNDRLQEKYQRIRENEKRFESYYVDDADIILVAYGSMARVCVECHEHGPGRGEEGRHDPSDFPVALPRYRL